MYIPSFYLCNITPSYDKRAKSKSYGRSSCKSPFDTKTDRLSLFSISRSYLKRIPQSIEQTCVCVWLFWPPTILGILFHFSLR